MRCDEVEEFVSATYDGEAIPQQAAEHLAHCAACQDLLRSFAEMGAELRSFGSLQSAAAVPEYRWVRPGRTITLWWKKGWRMMRIPRFAFAGLVLLLFVLGSRLALVEVRAYEGGPVLLLKISLNNAGALKCALSATQPGSQQCSGILGVGGGNLSLSVRLLKKDGDRALLSLRSQSGQQTTITEEEAKTMPETQVWVSAEAPTETSLGGTETRLTAQWTDHIPVMLGENQYLDPSASELRLTSPLLLRDNRVFGDIEGATAIGDRPGEGVYLYIPGEGRFVMSLTQFEGAVSGKIGLNRISFTAEGHPYVIVTGAPVARGEVIWVKHDASYKPPTGTPDGAYIGAAPVSELRTEQAP